MASSPTILHASGVTRVTLGASVSCNVGDLIGFDGSNWVLADADARVAAEFVAMETQPAGGSVAVCQAGVLYDPDAPFTAGSSYYLSTTAGSYAPTPPAASATLTILQRVGKAVTTDTLAFNVLRHGPLFLRAQVTYDPASLAATTARNDTVSVTGLLTTDVVRGGSTVNNALEAGLVISQMDVSAADTLRIRLHNPTAGAVDGASLIHTIVVERYT
ncbi:MAG TPA: hypothetical protein VFC51_16330 [Chloroflexota bacterium]|nr:hypothetical protein [Chloroflexota bacterium]